MADQVNSHEDVVTTRVQLSGRIPDGIQTNSHISIFLSMAHIQELVDGCSTILKSNPDSAELEIQFLGGRNARLIISSQRLPF